MRMDIGAIILFVLIGTAVGYAICAGQAQARGLRECEECIARDAGSASTAGERSIPPRVTRAIRTAAAAADRLVAIEADRAGVSGLTEGSRVWVDLDAISAIESGDHDEAVGAAGERGRYQITEAAWTDTMAWLKRHRGYRVTWLFNARAHDNGFARVIAGTYLNDILPRWLTCERLDRSDSTGPVPDSLMARVAAYNCGAKRVRQAYARWQAAAGTSRHWVSYLPASTQNYLTAYAVASGVAAGDAAREVK